MKTYWKILAAAAACMALATACNNDDEGNDTPGLNGDITPGTTLTGNITSDATLTEGNSYRLSGGLHVKAGATLRIEPGVELVAVDDEIPDYILIEQGAKIDAQGTAAHPIVMTSELKESGAWGGIHICGYAHTNAGAGVLSEIGNAPYGGDNDADNSGTLRYIRLEYTGFALDEEHEANGVSFYGVGNGTTVEYLQAYKGSDDGFEFFGGSVNVRYLVSTSCSDDSFDWTEGWNGKGQFLVAFQEAESTLGYDCDCLMECDNNGNNAAATPVAHPVLANVTLVGNNSQTGNRGVRLRAGTEVELYNAIITGKPKCLTVETPETESSFSKQQTPSVLEYISMSTVLDSKEGIYTNEDFEAAAGNATDYVNALTDGYVGTIQGGKTLSDSFFTTAAYKGAVSASDDWTAGWTL
ncbi:hypothetical protein [uncultured Alistipes sp.]|uniref:hypothetical protein n=1 Tax=uncultured Alistipes sp. TaxID=538949 RepID=UPI00262DE8A0|nr:hypothetical protein [uncultured Alistipes sp.]